MTSASEAARREAGLTKQEAEARLDQFGPNEQRLHSIILFWLDIWLLRVPRAEGTSSQAGD